ncbi:hypothetical protein NQ315_001947 [Exocentrus adspersus]|uniref:Carboxylesterase type B domain-containing protein n=1 Tax=Exocentrus adspersus TaxID=1586481 RepID=A0AAV8WA50_9CUCU|nr:hypothetical protein NQ315_001947 [Exocentrus adspersus]
MSTGYISSNCQAPARPNSRTHPVFTLRRQKILCLSGHPEPQAPKKWDKILNTTHNTHSCYLTEYRDDKAPDVTESEDCLYLNVYTPVEPGSKATPLPVLFWIHGGGYYFGDGTFQVYGPQFLIDYDIVIVTINYRLGALGLFRGAILHSGTALCTWGLQRFARYYAFKLGTTLDPKFKSDNSTELLKLLQSVSADAIVNITLNIPTENIIGVDKESIWGPVIENEKLSNSFITGPMHEDIRTGNINKVPIMLGYNSEEELLFVGDGKDVMELAKNMDEDLSRVVNNKFNITEKDKPVVGRLLRKLYTNDTFQKHLGAIVRYLSDEGFATPTIRHAKLQSKHTDVYLYQFAYEGMISFTNITIEGVDTVGHAEELKYLWHVDRLDDGGIFPIADRLTQRRMLNLWSNFVKHLNPTPECDPLFDNILWPKVTPGKIRYFNINRTLEVRTNPRNYDQFEAIVDKYANPPLVTY